MGSLTHFDKGSELQLSYGVRGKLTWSLRCWDPCCTAVQCDDALCSERALLGTLLATPTSTGVLSCNLVMVSEESMGILASFDVGPELQLVMV